jgi:SAM-dependent methyltransferase
LKSAIAALYRRIVPEPVRRFVRDRLTARGYSRSFFAQMDQAQAASYAVLAETIVERLHPSSVVDVGCGSGGLLAALARHDVPRLLGLESSPDGVRLARRRNVDVRVCDLSKPFKLDESFDVAVCLEVAEHLPGSLAEQFADGLASGPDVLVFSAATPGQGGENHINEQPHEYWIEKLRARGFVIDEHATQEVRADWTKRGVASWYCRNVIFFRR